MTIMMQHTLSKLGNLSGC